MTRTASTGDESPVTHKPKPPVIKPRVKPPRVIIEDADAMPDPVAGIVTKTTSPIPQVLPPDITDDTTPETSPNAKQERLLEFGGLNNSMNDQEIHVEKAEAQHVERPRTLDKVQHQSPQEMSKDSDITYPEIEQSGDNVDDNALGDTGFTQSDSSISSTNPSYCYGNQSEYMATGNYGNVAYSPGETAFHFPVGPVSFQNPVYMTSPEELKNSVHQNSSDTDTVEDNYFVNQNSEDRDVNNENDNLTDHSQDDPILHLGKCQTDLQEKKNDFAQYDNDSFTDNDGDLNQNLVDTDNSHNAKINFIPPDAQWNPEDSNTYPAQHKSSKSKVGFNLDLQNDLGLEGSDVEENANSSLLDNERMCQNDSPPGNCDECSFLLGPEFEGMEPTYV